MFLTGVKKTIKRIPDINTLKWKGKHQWWMKLFVRLCSSLYNEQKKRQKINDSYEGEGK